MNERLKNAFDSIYAEEKLKQHTKEYIFRKMENANRGTQKLHGRMAAVLACLCFAVFGAGGWFAYFIPVSAISLDVNPSVELEINRFDKVVSSFGYNEDGCEVLNELDIKHMDYRTALAQLMESESMAQYVDQGQEVSITVTGKDEQKNEELMSAVSEYMSEKNVVLTSCGRQEVEAAHEAGVSFGKYKAFLELQSLDPNVTEEEVQQLTMRQIRSRIAELSEDAEDTAQTDGCETKGSQYNGEGKSGQHNGEGKGGNSLSGSGNGEKRRKQKNKL